MKLGTTSLPKFNSLKKQLKLPNYAVIGLLESFWMLACQTADDGDLSKYSNQELADNAEYDKDANELIEALVTTRWLDRDGNKLLVHDWEEHCPKFVRDRKAKREQRATKPRELQKPSAHGGNLSPNVADNRQHVATDNGQSPLFHSIPSESSQADSMNDDVVVVDDSFSFGDFSFGELKQQANSLIELLPQGYRAEHREEVWRITFGAMTLEGISLVKQWKRAIQRNKPNHLVDYLLGCIRKSCEERKQDWYSIRSNAPACPPEPKPRILSMKPSA